MTQIDQANTFHALHTKGDPVIIYNVWDAGSAKAVADAGAKAIATGSAPVAMADGFGDGENIPIDQVLANISRICSAVPLPVSLDFEGAYSADPVAGAENIGMAIEAGAVGINFEDQVVGGSGLHPVADQAKRIEAARAKADDLNLPLFINARTDIFLHAMKAGEAHTAEMLDAAVERAEALANAGASGFFAPGLLDLEMIRELCDRVSLPVNIIALPGAPSNKELAAAGVARISYGPVPYRQMIAWFEDQAKSALESLA